MTGELVILKAAGGVPALHPERKGQLERSPKKNWVEALGGLPLYINSFATAIHRENPGWSISRVIATAVNQVRKIAVTGRAMNLKGQPKVSPAVRAAAIAAIAKWEAMKKAAGGIKTSEGVRMEEGVYALAQASTKPWSSFSQSDYTDEQWARACLVKVGNSGNKSDYKFPVREPSGALNRNAVHAAAGRVNSASLSPEQKSSLKSKIRSLYKQLGETPPDSLKLSEEGDLEIPEILNQDEAALAEADAGILPEAKAAFDNFVKEAEAMEDQRRRRRIIQEAASRLASLYGNFSEEVPQDVAEVATLSDEEMVEELTGEEVEDGQWEMAELEGEEADAYMSALEEAAEPTVGYLLPTTTDKAIKLGTGKLWQKQILRAGTINYHGRQFTITPEELKLAVENFKKKALDYIPLQFSGDNNEHTDASDKYAGKVEELQLSKDGSSLIGIFSLTPEAERIVKHNPNFGVSVFWHSAYKRMSDNKYFGPNVMHVAAVHRPAISGMDAWKAMLSEEAPEGVSAYVNLSDANYEQEKEVGELSDDNTAVVEGNEGVQTITLSEDELNARIEARLAEERESYQAALAQMKAEAHAERVATLSEEWKREGVPAYAVDVIAPVLSAHMPDEEGSYKLSEGDDEVEVNTYGALTRVLDSLKGTVNLSEETGSQDEDDFENDLPEDLQAGADFLLNHS